MNGRCETDPFDQARNVCGLCYGEYCLSCLVNVKGRKHPLCKECAIIASGIRAGAKPTLRGPKRTAAARRKALLETPVQESFQYFDTGAGADLDAFEEAMATAETEAAAPKGKRGKPSKNASAKKAPAKKKAARKPAAKGEKSGRKPAVKKPRSPKKTPKKQQQANAAAAEASDPTQSAVDPDATISSSERLAGVAAPPPAAAPEPSAPASSDTNTGAESPVVEQPAANDDSGVAGSAVDQLDSIREQALDDTVAIPETGAGAFRKPRPFIKPATTADPKTAAAELDHTPSPSGPPVQEPAPTQELPQPQPAAAPVAEQAPEPTVTTAPVSTTPIDTHAAAEEARAGSPKPLARRRGSSGATSKKATPSADTSADSADRPAAAASKPEPVKAAEDAAAASSKDSTDPSITSELSSPFSVAPPPPLPRRRAKPSAGQDPYERSNPDEVATTNPGTKPNRRQSDQASDSAAAEDQSSPQESAAALPKRRRGSEAAAIASNSVANDSISNERADAPSDEDLDEAPAIRPPAWTQRPHGRRSSDAPQFDASDETADDAIDDLDDEQPTLVTAAGPKPLPKRRRSS